MARPLDAETASTGAAGKTLEQNWRRTLPTNAIASKGRVGIGESTRKSWCKRIDGWFLPFL